MLLTQRRWVLAIVLAPTLFGNVFAEPAASPIWLHHKLRSTSVPVAIYRSIRVDEFRKLVTRAFEASGFAFVAITHDKDGALRYRFSYSALLEGKAENYALVLRVDENVDKKGRCANCFLRFAELPDARAMGRLPWMAQYDLSSRIFPGIDRAFDRIRADGQKYMDAGFGFNYTQQWQGERNQYGNSFSAVSLPDLKTAVVNAYRAAGFLPTGDAQAARSSEPLELNFVFPLEADAGTGPAYKVVVFHQLDPRGNCYPCEVVESFDPYQTLPAAGLSGMASRLTLESRFTIARTLAFDNMRAATERHLRPRSVFTVPPKPAPLGSPRPPPTPAVVT